MVLLRFRSCSKKVKLYIFQTYFSNIYCMSLWSPVRKQALKGVQVAYNNAFRLLFGYGKMCSASAMFCENHVLQSIFHSRIFINSSLYRSWRELLLHELDENESDLYSTIVQYT